MGWEILDASVLISVRLDRHNGERQKAHNVLFQRFCAELREAVQAVTTKPEYKEIIDSVDCYNPGED